MKCILEENGIDVIGIFEVIGFSEILDGCLKILYFNVYGVLLVLCDNEEY